MQPDIPIKQMVSFRVLDAFLSNYKNNKQIYCQIFEKKQSLINLVAQRKLTPQIYKQLIEKALATTKNSEIKSQLETDLFNFKEISNGNLDSWFEDCVNDTGQLNDYEGQKATFQKYKADLLSKNKTANKTQTPTQQNKTIEQKKIEQKIVQQKQQVKVANANFNTAQVVNFLGMDIFMEKHKNNEEIYKKILENKKKMLNFVDMNKLVGATYKGMIEKSKNNTTNLQLKNTIKLELDELQTKFKGNVQNWFKQTIQMTTQNLPKQQVYLLRDKTISKKSEKMQQPRKKEPQKKQQIINSKTQSKDKSQIQNIMKNYFLSLRVLDSLLSTYQEDKDIFLQLYERKKKLMDKIKSKALLGQMYLSLIKKSLENCSNNEIKSEYIMDLDNLNMNDGNITAWFQDIVSDTQFNIQSQQENYQIHMGIKDVKKAKQKPSSNEELAYVQDTINNNFCTFKILDSLIDEYGQNKQIFCILFQAKQQLMKNIQSKTITGQNYQMLINKSLSKCSNILLKDIYDADILQLSLVHEDEHGPWFKAIVEKALVNYSQQQAKYNEYRILFPKQQQQPIRASVTRQSISRIEISRASIQNVQSHEIDNLLNQNFLTFRLIDSLLEKFQQDRIAFCKIFEQKKKLLEKIKSLTITAKKYQELIQAAKNNTTKQQLTYCRQQLKEQYDMDLLNLQSMNNGNHDEWFEELIEDTGMYYQAQQKRYKDYVKKNKKQASQSSEIIVETQYLMDDIISLTALKELLDKRKDNKQYYTELKLRKKKFAQAIEKKQLGPFQYKASLQERLDIELQPFLKQKIEQQLKRLKQQFNNNIPKWFISIVSSIDGINAQILNKNVIYEKLSFILKKLSQYQSVVICYSKCKEEKAQERLAEFNKKYFLPAKKKFNHLKTKIENGQFNIDDLDPIEFCNKHIPDISFEIINGSDRETYKKQLVGMLIKMNATINEYNQYIKLLKRNANKKNIQQAKKAIQQIQKDIAQIKQMAKSEQLVPKPIFQVQKIQKQQIDFFEMGDNELQVQVHSVEGMNGKMTIKFYVIDTQHDRYQADITNGNVKISFGIILSENNMDTVLKGQQKQLLIKFIKKGWFSSSLVCQQWVTLAFINNNVFQKRVQIGDIVLNLTAKVKKPKRLRPTVINGYKLIKFEPYQHTKFIENEFVKNMLPNQNPSTQSQIQS